MTARRGAFANGDIHNVIPIEKHSPRILYIRSPLCRARAFFLFFSCATRGRNDIFLSAEKSSYLARRELNQSRERGLAHFARLLRLEEKEKEIRNIKSRYEPDDAVVYGFVQIYKVAL